MSRSRRRTQDHFGRRARREGFPARSVYKLEEIDRRVRLLRRGQRVLDLGSSPGSWAIYAASRVAPEGHVLGVDIKAPTGALPAHVEHRVLDVFDLDVDELGGPGSFDVVLSDMAPSTTGQRALDQYRSFELYMRALGLASVLLRPRGGVVGKIFQGAEFPEAQAATSALFDKARVLRPDATRDSSYEVFLVGLGRNDAPPLA